MHGGHGFPATSAVALALVAAALAAYLEGARRDRRWPAGRTAAFGAGAAVLAVAFWPSVVTWAHGDLRGHMVQHVAVGMLAPLGLVLGAPVTLALRRLSVPRARAVTRVLNSQPVRFVSHPATALVLNLGGMTALYATPLYAAAAASPPLHAAVHVHTLAAGCLFTWAVLAGPDPAPHAPGLRARLGVLFLAAGGHAVLAKMMYGHGLPRGTGADLEAVRSAAQVMYYGGDLAEGLLAVALFARWYRARGRAGVRGSGFRVRVLPGLVRPTPETGAKRAAPIR